MRLLCYVASEITSNRTCTLEPIKCFKTMLLVDSAVFTLPFLVGLAAGLVRTGWESALLPSAGLAFRHGVLLAIALCALANAEAPPRRGVLYVLRTLALALCCGWMIASPFARESFALLLVASLLLLASNIASARQRPPMAGLYRIAGSAFFVVGNGLLFPDMPSHVVVSWWLGAVLFYVLGLHMEKGTLRPGESERPMLYALIALALGGAVLKNYALGAEFLDPYSVTPLLLWGGDRLIGLVLCTAALWLLVRDASDGWQRLCALGGSLFLAAAGGLALYTGQILAGPLYEAIIHAFFVGFAVSLLLALFHLNSYLALGSLLALYLGLLAWIVGALSDASAIADAGSAVVTLCLVVLAALCVRAYRQAARFAH
jgi:hypothetical protein